MTDALWNVLLAFVGFFAGLLASKIVDWWKFINARTRYAHFHKKFPKECIILIDSAIPKFEIDGQSIAPTEERFFLRPKRGIGFEEINVSMDKYFNSAPFVFGDDEIFGSNKLEKLVEITGIPDLPERISRSRDKVSAKFLAKQDGKIFNGKKFGLRNFAFDRVGDDERSRLDLRVYETDYFTHSVMQDVIQEYMNHNKSFIIEVEKDISTINRRYYPFLTSVGLNVFIFTDLKRNIIFSRRSSSIAFGNAAEGKLHVSMNEGLSFTDFEFQQRGEGQVTLVNCFRRGMREELGFSEYDSRIGDLNVYDIFVVKRSFQFGLFAWCTFQGHFPEIADFRAQDKQMESSELVEVAFRSSALHKMISEERFVPYTRVGLENLCRIHGISTYDVDARGFDYFVIWFSLAASSLIHRR